LRVWLQRYARGQSDTQTDTDTQTDRHTDRHRHTDRQTQTCSSQYCTTALMGEVTIAFYSTNTTALTTCAEDK